jgi:hypothetical protein
MRILRMRYDELNRYSGRLVLKTDMQEYIAKVQLMVERALKNSGFDQHPVYIDRAAKKRVHASEIVNKGNVARR